MNEATKARIANILTAIVTIVTVIQGTFLTDPPFSQQVIFTIGAVFTYLAMVLTAVKQHLSPDVNSTGVKVTLWTIGITTVAGLADLVGIFHLADGPTQYVKWTISVVVMIMNVLSKQLFPSYDQKAKMIELKQEVKG